MTTIKYELLAEKLRDKIQAGALKPGDMLMSRSQMEKHYKVSATTINRTLDALSEEGLIIRLKGKGCFVAEKKYRGAKTVAVICPMSVNPSKTDIAPFLVNAVASSLRGTGFAPLLFDSNDWKAGFSAALRQKAAGVLSMVNEPAAMDYMAAEMKRTGIPVVFLDKKGPAGGYVGTDHFRGALLAVQKALDMGYDKIYHFFETTRFMSVIERKLGYAHAMTLADLNTRLIPVDVSETAYIPAFYNAMLENREILKEKCAVFTTNGDGMTGVWRAVCDIRPDVYPALISFDDPDMALPEGVPFINVVQDLSEIGSRAVGMLLANILEDKPLSDVKISPEIIEGNKMHMALSEAADCRK
ncbi:MAG: LacI family DNA-binding transcriptional regulator [Abditibacteriota bacterium]|nr:LacI family DNA-binding transcriptional regulator [Abditibacteriota bacterium]